MTLCKFGVYAAGSIIVLIHTFLLCWTLSWADISTIPTSLRLAPLNERSAPSKQTEAYAITKNNTNLGGSLNFRSWMSDGSFSMKGHPPDSANSWELKHPVDSNLYLANLMLFEIKLSQMVALDVSYGGGDIKKGRIVDTDWNTTGVITDLSYSTSEGKTQYLSGFLSYRLLGSCPIRRKTYDKTNQSSTGVLDISLGYHQLKNSVTYQDPLILINQYNPEDEGTSWKEEWLTYDLTYRGIGIRLKGEYRLSKALTLSGLVGYLPALDARYRGVRYPERTPAPPPGEGDPADPGYPDYDGYQKQERIKTKGQAPEAEIKLCIYPTTSLSFWVGYKYIRFETEGEDEKGTYWAGSHEELKTTLQGWLLGINFIF